MFFSSENIFFIMIIFKIILKENKFMINLYYFIFIIEKEMLLIRDK